MKRPSVLAPLSAAVAAIAICALGAAPAPGASVVYAFAALPGPASTCQWFDDTIGTDHSLGAIVQQTNLLYNRVALPYAAPVNVTQTATTARGDQVVQFNLGNRLVCAGVEAINPPTPEPSPT